MPQIFFHLKEYKPITRALAMPSHFAYLRAGSTACSARTNKFETGKKWGEIQTVRTAPSLQDQAIEF